MIFVCSSDCFIMDICFRAQAVAIGQDLLDHGWIESVPTANEDVFKDEYWLYQPGKVRLILLVYLSYFILLASWSD